MSRVIGHRMRRHGKDDPRDPRSRVRVRLHRLACGCAVEVQSVEPRTEITCEVHDGAPPPSNATTRQLELFGGSR